MNMRTLSKYSYVETCFAWRFNFLNSHQLLPIHTFPIIEIDIGSTIEALRAPE